VRLAETQELFAALVTGERTVDPAFRDACLVGDDELAAAQRARIYSDMYLFRLVDAVREDYPQLAHFLGADRFFALAAEYVRAHPSRNPSLAHLGRELPAFLSGRENDRADLAVLATIEWARAEAFIAADAESLDASALQVLAENAPAARLVLHPSLRLLALDYDGAALWSALEKHREPDPPIRTPTQLLVWRKGFEVFHAPVSLEELAALEAVRRGATLGEACEAFAALPQPAHAALEAVTSWCGEGLISGIAT
jgi:hypothetical protein